VSVIIFSLGGQDPPPTPLDLFSSRFLSYARDQFEDCSLRFADLARLARTKRPSNSPDRPFLAFLDLPRRSESLEGIFSLLERGFLRSLDPHRRRVESGEVDQD